MKYFDNFEAHEKHKLNITNRCNLFYSFFQSPPVE